MFGMMVVPSRTVVACVVLLWATFWVRLGMSSEGRGLQFQYDIEFFDGSAVAPASKLPKSHIPLLNSDFELITVTGNGTVLASVTDTALIPNWLPGGSGVQILQKSSYQMSSFAPSVFAIHLNNPSSTTNSTQGSIATLTLTEDPHPATLYTVQYDCARHPDGPLNLLPTLKISSMSGSTVNYFAFQDARINYTDTPKQITWIRQSMLFMGTGAPTSIKFESMSEKYGPIIDNVVLLHGVHILNPNSAPPPCSSSMLPLMCPIFTIVALMLTVPCNSHKPSSSS